MLSANVHLLTSCFVNFPKEFTEYKMLRGTKSSAVTKSPVESGQGKWVDYIASRLSDFIPHNKFVLRIIKLSNLISFQIK